MSIYAVNRILVGTRYFSAKRRLLQSVGCQIGENTKIVGPIFCTGTLCIGANCWIGRNLTVGESYKIAVGNGTWIGGRSTILGNTTIGDGCVVAACACVVGDVEKNVLTGGVPAKKIRDL